MAYFVVVHHRRDNDQPWANGWLDDDRLRAITTTSDIAAQCALIKGLGERIFVHRCGWAGRAPVICCSVVVEDTRYDAKIGWVRFRDPVVHHDPPPVQPGRGQNWYEAEPPNSSTA